MDKICDRKFFEVGGHWPLLREGKNPAFYLTESDYDGRHNHQ